MRTLNSLILALVGILLIASSADAVETRPLQKKYSKQHVFAACERAGGSWSAYSNGGYGCTKANCDGKGGDCVVDCKKDGSCIGVTPTRQRKGRESPLQILRPIPSPTRGEPTQCRCKLGAPCPPGCIPPTTGPTLPTTRQQ